MRTILAAILATAVAASSAYAQTSAAPLSPGKPAGVKQAELGTVGLPLLALGGLLGIGAILYSVTTANGVTTTTSTSSTSP